MPPPFTTGDDIASLSFLPGQPVTFDYDALAGFDRAMLDFSALTSNFTVSLSADFYRLLSADGQIDITLRRFERIEILGSQGNDTLFDAGHTVQFVIDAGAGNDSLSGWTQADTLLGGAGDDHLFSQAGNDSLDGGDGNDTVNGHAGNDTVLGGAGHDTVNGGFDNDLLYGGEGDDLIFGEAQGNFAEPYTNDWNTFGTDTIYGGAGNDILLSYAAADTLIGGAGNDTIYGGATAADLRDAIYGGDGDDYIDGGYGNDDLSGGNGNDTVLGDFGADTVIGNAGNDLLTGAAGSDLMFGNDGADTLNGGFGHDRMNGGAGADRFFHLGVLDHGSDWVQDYSAADGDVLVFGQSGASAAQFQVNMAVTAGAGSAGVAEAFVIWRPTGQILWALVDGGDEAQIRVDLGGMIVDLLA